MKKTTTAVSALVLAFLNAPVFASTARMVSLGLDAWQLDDETNIWSNPALIHSYPDLVTVEIGTQTTAGTSINGGTQWGGFNKSIGPTVFGLYIRRPYMPNDFSDSAFPLLTPTIGGLITTSNVTATPGLVTSNFANGGPFDTAHGSQLGITNAPSVVADPSLYTRNLSIPANYFDLFFAFPMSSLWDFGMRFNYARNAPEQTTHASYASGNTGAATDGTITLDRDADEFNFTLGLDRKPEDSGIFGFQLVGSLSRPSYSMRYEEDRMDGAFFRSRLDIGSAVNSGALMRLSWKLDNGSTHALTFHGTIQETSGEGTLQQGSSAGLSANQDATFTNDRRYGAADYTWIHSFTQGLLAASIGLQKSRTTQTWFFSDLMGATAHAENSIEIEELLVPVRVAAEIKPWNLLAIRAGIQKNYFAQVNNQTSLVSGAGQPVVTETDKVADEAAGTANGVGLSFGLGFALTEGLMVDSVVRQNLLFHGPYFVGGVSGNGVFAHLTLTYKFGENKPELEPVIHLKKKDLKKDLLY